jgi:hypothetical protein
MSLLVRVDRPCVTLSDYLIKVVITSEIKELTVFHAPHSPWLAGTISTKLGRIGVLLLSAATAATAVAAVAATAVAWVITQTTASLLGSGSNSSVSTRRPPAWQLARTSRVYSRLENLCRGENGFVVRVPQDF